LGRFGNLLGLRKSPLTLSEILVNSMSDPLNHQFADGNISLGKILREGTLQERQRFVRIRLRHQNVSLENAKPPRPFFTAGAVAEITLVSVLKRAHEIAVLNFLQNPIMKGLTTRSGITPKPSGHC
jgi:hypothetical protein